MKRDSQNQIDEVRPEAGPDSPCSSELSGKSISQDNPVGRRMFFSAGLASLASIILASCSNGEDADFADKGGSQLNSILGDENATVDDISPNSGTTSASAKGNPKDGQVADASGKDGKTNDDNGDQDSSGDSNSNQPDKECLANDTKELTIDELPLATNEYKPVFRFYGKPSSTLIALHFDQYLNSAAKKIKQIIIMRENGRLLALHGFNAADVRDDNKARPIIIDHMALNGEAKIKVLIQLSDGSRLRHVEPVSYFNKYNDGADVIDLAEGTGGGWRPTLQSIARFGAEAEGANAESAGFKPDEDYKYPLPGPGYRFLYSAQTNAKFVPSTAGSLQGEVTDIMGNVLGNASDFKDILEYQVICIYAEMGDGKYMRTMLKIG